jgi:hypothetical protein
MIQKSVSFHSVSVKGHVKVFLNGSVIFQSDPPLVPYLHNSSQEQMFLEQSRKGVGTVVHAMCQSTGDNMLNDLKKKEHENTK